MRLHMVLYYALVRVEPSNSAVMRWLSGGGGEGWALDSPEIMTSSSSCWETLSPFRRLWNSEKDIIMWMDVTLRETNCCVASQPHEAALH